MISKSKQKEIEKYVNSSKKYYSKIFNQNEEIDTKLYILNREEAKKIWGKNLPIWVYQFYNKKGMIIINDIPKEKLNSKDLKIGIYHEMCHNFYFKLLGTYLPQWVDEGLANYLANYKFKDKTFMKFISDYKKDFPKQDYLKIAKKYYKLSEKDWLDNNKTREFYACSFLAVKKIIDQKGLNYLFNWLNKFKINPIKKNYNNKIYGLLKIIK